MQRRHTYLFLLLALCIGSRFLSTIFYIEDPDSLRFALSVYNGFDVTQLQPHFPGYPVFWATARLVYLISGQLALTFSLLGGLAVFGLIYYTVRLTEEELFSPAGLALTALIFFNPLIWLMSNRYMPDLLGLSCAVGAFYYLSAQTKRPWIRLLGFLLAGLLAGLRLSYLPLLFIPVVFVLWQEEKRWQNIAWGTVGVLVWLVPMTLDTGWVELIEAAQAQTSGHFTEFGGTFITASDLGLRMVKTVESLWADGLGAYWPGRHWVTGWVALGSVILLSVGIWQVKENQLPCRIKALGMSSWVTYGLWMFFFQNVIHKPRHVLPLLLGVLIVLAFGAARLYRKQRLGQYLAVFFLVAYAGVTSVLVFQHQTPSALAQIKHQLEHYSSDSLQVVSIPLVNNYLAGQGVNAAFVSVEHPGDWQKLRRVVAHQPTVLIGEHLPAGLPTPTRIDTFYHNPYVNRMWPTVKLYEYDQ